MRPLLSLVLLEDRLAPAGILPDLSGEVLAHVRGIALQGRAAGLNPNAFVKLGDSNTYRDGFFGPVGSIPATAGLDPADAATVGRFAGAFTRRGLAAYPGWNTLDVARVAGAEIDAVRPAVALITLGTNDWTYPFDQFRGALSALVRAVAARGVVPVVTTLPVNQYAGGVFEARTQAYSRVVEEVAAAERVPLIDLRQATAGLPFSGLDDSGVHLNVSPSGGGSFTPFDRLFGQNERGFVTIQTLTRLEAVIDFDSNSGWADPTHWTPLAAGQAVFAVGSDAGDPGEVVLYDTDTRQELGRVRPFERSFLGGVKVAVADVTGDGVSDLVAAAGYGGGPLVVVYDGRTGEVASRFFAYEPSLRGGVNIAAGDTDADGRAEIVAGAAEGGGPRVRVFRGDGTPGLDFYAFDAGLRTGVTVAAVGDGVATGAGVGGGPVVKLFDGRTGTERAAAFVYDPNFRGGVTLAGGDLDGDGRPELVTAPGPGGSPYIRVFDPATLGERASFRALDSADPATGTRVAVSGRRIVIATGPGRGLAVRTLDGADAGTQRFPERFPFAAVSVG